MKNLFLRPLWIAMLVSFVGTASAADLTLYVKPDGNDQAGGATEQAAFGSLQAALESALSLSLIHI